MKLIASTLIAILLLAHAGQAYKNLCHGLVGSKFAELKRFELGNYVRTLIFLMTPTAI